MARTERIADNLEGINLRRQSGGASKNDLIDLLNGFRTPKGTINSRPGTAHVFAIPAGTKGALGFADKLHVFSHATVSHAIASLVVNVLRHPNGGGATIRKIHRAFPFFGRIYVVAEFTDNIVQHYWLENPDAWVAQTVYEPGDSVQPTTPNGYYYDAQVSTRADVKWSANTPKLANDIVQPTTYNGLFYVLTASVGAPIKTSNTEPTWPLTDLITFNTVIERRYLSDADLSPTTPVPADPPDPTPGGGGPSGGAGNYGPFPPRDFRRIE